MVNYSKLREVLGLRESRLFNTEYFVWQRVPCTAIIKSWSWDKLRSTLGSISPALGDPISLSPSQKRSLAELRNLLRSEDPNIETLVIHLIDNLKLLPQILTTKQVAMMILGWLRGKSDSRLYDSLEANLTPIIPDKIAELDYRLYAKTCRWNLDRQQHCVQDLNGNLEGSRSQLRIARNFNILTYEQWFTERNLTEELACSEMRSTKFENQSLLSILNRNGLEFSAPPSFRRPPRGLLKLTLSRRKWYLYLSRQSAIRGVL